MTNLDIQNAYLGVDQVDAVYMGDEQVWPTGTPTYGGLTLNIISAGTVQFSIQNKSGAPQAPEMSLEYSYNGGTWTPFTSSTTGQTWQVQAGDTLWFRGDNQAAGTGLSQSQVSQNTFSGSTAWFTLEGNVMSIISKDHYEDTAYHSLTANYQLAGLFRKCTGLTYATGLTMPSDIITSGGCENMFADCSNLIQGPDLNAYQVAGIAGNSNGPWGYQDMFKGCTSLTAIKCLARTPNYPATNPSEYRFSGFYASGQIARGGTLYKFPVTSWNLTYPSNISWTQTDADV